MTHHDVILGTPIQCLNTLSSCRNHRFFYFFDNFMQQQKYKNFTYTSNSWYMETMIFRTAKNLLCQLLNKIVRGATLTNPLSLSPRSYSITQWARNIPPTSQKNFQSSIFNHIVCFFTSKSTIKFCRTGNLQKTTNRKEKFTFFKNVPWGFSINHKNMFISVS